ncbi:MAG: hypothetical protein DMG31_11800 [Acidobacteria bacterium]|nr:MAG: hypothetical protein DMG31_11800 [Acidobacteriota bacterium]
MIARFSFLTAGIGFTIQGIYGIYFFSARGPGHGDDWRGIFTALSFLGFPMGILCLSIFYLWTVRPTVAHSWGYLEFGVCLLVHAVQFVFALTVLGEPLRFGGALLAISFGLGNFISALRAG